MVGELRAGDRVSYLDDYGKTVTGTVVARRNRGAPPLAVHVELDRPRKPVVWFERAELTRLTRLADDTGRKERG